MNIKSLRAFRLTLSEGSLAGAAEQLNLSQPAVSRLISALEGELRMELFYRTGRRLKPTPEALAFSKEAGRILDNLDQIPKIAADIRAGRQESLRVIAMPRIANALISPVISQFMTEHKNIRINVDVQSRQEAYKWAAGREYDLGVGALPIDDNDIETRVILRARAQVLLPVNHPLAAEQEISAETLASEPIIALTSGLLLRNQVDDLFQSTGLTPAYACEVSASMLAYRLVESGAGITIMDALSAAGADTSKVVLRPVLPEKWLSFGLLLPRGQELSEHSLRLIHLLEQQAKQLAEDPGIEVVS